MAETGEPGVDSDSEPAARPRWRWRGWLSEAHRTAAALALAVLIVVPWTLITGDAEPSFARQADLFVLFVGLYLVWYLIITCVSFMQASEGQVASWARREGRGTWLQRYFFGTAPGPGLSISMGTTALLVAVLWLPGSRFGESTFDGGVRIGLAVVVIACAWAAVAVSFAVAYHADNLLEHRRAMQFPGDQRPGWIDYLYFAVSVSTTFGTTDVVVRSTLLRRTVIVHSLLAFVFNTIILGAVVGFLVST